MAEEEKKVMDGAEVVAEAPKVTKAKGKKGKRVVTSGQVHVQATFNLSLIHI